MYYCITVPHIKKAANWVWLEPGILAVLFSLKDHSQSLAWAEIKAPHWVFRNCLNSLLMGRAEEATSASWNESKSARVTVIDWSSWSLFSRLIVDALYQRRVNKCSKNSKGVLWVSLSLIRTALTSLFYTKERTTPTCALASTRSSNYNDWVVLKVFYSFSSKRAGWLVWCLLEL